MFREGRRRWTEAHIGAPGFEPGTSPTRTVRATRLRHAPSVTSLQANAWWPFQAIIAEVTCGPSEAVAGATPTNPPSRSGGDRLVVADREAGHQGLEAFFDGEPVGTRVLA